MLEVPGQYAVPEFGGVGGCAGYGEVGGAEECFGGGLHGVGFGHGMLELCLGKMRRGVGELYS